MSTNDPGHSEPEYVGSDTPAAAPADSGEPPRGRGKRTGLVAAAAVAVVAAVGVGAYGVVQLMSGGSSAATAVPADAIGYVSLDLDPSASQKIEAFKMLRKFPSIKKELGGRDDIRKAVFEEIRTEGGCKELDYAKDVEPWIGNRIAVAAVPDSKKGALPLVVLQVTDGDKAKAGAAKLIECGDDGDSADKTGFAITGDYLLITETQKQADAMAKDAEAASLDDSDEFTTAMDRVGDPGIVTMYASKDAPDAVTTAIRNESGGDAADAGQVEKMFKDFDGAAGVVRFADGAVEAEFTAKGLPNSMGAVSGEAGPDAATLPSTTAAALSVAFRKGWLDDYLEQMSQMMGDDASLEDLYAQGEQATGLQLPEDIETLLGDGISVSVDASADIKELAESPDPTKVPAGIRIQGDPDKIVPIIDKLKKAAGPDADMVEVGTGDGVVSVGLSRDYVDTLLKKGDLGSEKAFQKAVPEADKASSVFFVNFDAGNGWAEELADLLSDGDPEVKQNIAPLDAVGISGWVDDDKVQHGLFKLSTD
jgi:hypothetical protein